MLLTSTCRERRGGGPALRREGTDITIAAYGATVYKALEAADVLAEKYGLSAEVIDLRFVAPLNYDKLIASVKKTGRLVDEGQLAAVMDEEALRAGELVLELGHDVNAQLLPGQVRPGKLEALGGLVLVLLDRGG